MIIFLEFDPELKKPNESKYCIDYFSLVHFDFVNGIGLLSLLNLSLAEHGYHLVLDILVFFKGFTHVLIFRILRVKSF
jgi:hypothetical protein